MDATMQSALLVAILVAIAEVVKIVVLRRLPKVAEPLKPGEAVAGFDTLVKRLQEELSALRLDNTTLRAEIAGLRTEMLRLQGIIREWEIRQADAAILERAATASAASAKAVAAALQQSPPPKEDNDAR